MKIEDLILSNNEQKNTFLKRCFCNEWADSYQECMIILEKCPTSEEVIYSILDSDTLKGSQVYAELSKTRRDHRMRVHADLENWTRTISDAGGLKIGNESFSINVPNGNGDGELYYTVVEKGCFNHDMLDFWTAVSGNEINIYDYDCGSDVIETLSGRYGVYSGYGFVVLEHWD